MMESKKTAIFALLGIAILWGYSFISSSKLVNNEVGSDILLFYRFSSGALILGIITFPQIKKSTFVDIKSGFLVGLCVLFAMYTQNQAFQFTSVAKIAFIGASCIILVPFLALIINKTKIIKKNIIGLIIAIIGVAILSVNDSLFTRINFGDFLAILSAFGFALQLVLIKHVSGKAHPVRIAFFQMVTVGLGGLILSLFSQSNLTNIFTGNNLYSFLYLAIIATGLCYFVQAWAAKKVSEVVLSVIISSQAIIGAIFDVIVFQTQVTLQLIIGSILISIAILYLTIETKKKNL